MRVGLGAGVPRRLQMPAQGLLIQIRARCQSELLDAVGNGIVVAVGCQVSDVQAHDRLRRRVSY